jgi:hypothetical protein
MGTGGSAGDSGAAGAGAAGAAGASGASGQAGAAGGCSLPKIVCKGVCLDPTNDPINCGDCGIVCPTGVCQADKCVGADSGNQVLVGMDFAYVTDPSMVTMKDDPGRVLANAVYLNSPRPDASWHVLGFDPSASPTSADVDGVITKYAAAHGVTTPQITHSTTAADAIAKLGSTSFDTFLIYDEPTAAKGSLGTAGTSLSATLTSFTKNGGNVVVLSSGTGTNEMWSFASKAQVMLTTGFTKLTLPTALANNASFDGVGQGVSSVFAGVTNTGFWTVQLDATIVDVIDTAGSGDPVVLHRAVSP